MTWNEMRIVKAVRTSIAFPSQWDAWNDDGEYVYLRYRSGIGYAKIYSDEDWCDREVPEQGTLVADFQYGHPLDGFITLEDFCKHANIELDLGGF
jgi:hypothetical protein